MAIEPRRIASIVRGHKIITTALTFTIVFVAIIWFFILSARTGLPPALNIDIPSHYLPGQPMPPESKCTYPYQTLSSDVIGCVDRVGDKLRYFLQFSTTKNIITRVTRYTGNDDIRLGDIIVHWGQPIGRDRYLVSWGNRSVYAFGKLGLTPSSKIYFISYDLVSEELEPWHGFVNTDPYFLEIKLPTLIPIEGP
jgi:hypothetical protein